MRTASRPKKPRRRRCRSRTSPHRLVDAGNPSHCHAACAAAYRACPHHCLVALAASPSSCRKTLSPETQNATVVLALQLHSALRLPSLGHNRGREPDGWCIVGGDAGVVVVVVAGGQSPDAFLVYARACGDLGEFVFGRVAWT